MRRTHLTERPELSENTREIYQLIRQQASLSRADIVRQNDLTFPSVSRIVAGLLDAEILQEGTRRRGGIGKPPTELSINPAHSYSLGVYKNGSQAQAVLIDVLGVPLQHGTFSFNPLAEHLKVMLEQAGVKPDKLLGVGLTQAGEAMSEQDLRLLAEALRVPVISEPAIAASLRAERYFGQAQHIERFVYYDALHLELGAMVGKTVLARSGTLSTLLGVADKAVLQDRNLIPAALVAATAVLLAEVLVISGLDDEDFTKIQASMTDVKVLPASPTASREAQAAATLPIYQAYSVL